GSLARHAAVRTFAGAPPARLAPAGHRRIRGRRAGHRRRVAPGRVRRAGPDDQARQGTYRSRGGPAVDRPMSDGPAAGTIDEAYDICERITREQARNFSWGIRLLPAPKRRALSAVYAVARRIDDIGDGDLPPDEKLRQLASAREGATNPGAHTDDPIYLA